MVLPVAIEKKTFQEMKFAIGLREEFLISKK